MTIAYVNLEYFIFRLILQTRIAIAIMISIIVPKSARLGNVGDRIIIKKEKRPERMNNKEFSTIFFLSRRLVNKKISSAIAHIISRGNI